MRDVDWVRLAQEETSSGLLLIWYWTFGLRKILGVSFIWRRLDRIL